MPVGRDRPQQLAQVERVACARREAGRAERVVRGRDRSADDRGHRRLLQRPQGDPRRAGLGAQRVDQRDGRARLVRAHRCHAARSAGPRSGARGRPASAMTTRRPNAGRPRRGAAGSPPRGSSPASRSRGPPRTRRPRRPARRPRPDPRATTHAAGAAAPASSSVALGRRRGLARRVSKSCRIAPKPRSRSRSLPRARMTRRPSTAARSAAAATSALLPLPAGPSTITRLAVTLARALRREAELAQLRLSFEQVGFGRDRNGPGYPPRPWMRHLEVQSGPCTLSRRWPVGRCIRASAPAPGIPLCPPMTA